ncbi:MAG: DNA-3-methyladenine glycosylase [Nocardioidaceae bacterium]|nr:DNA-3-methyladenine glycosylase [Nocardioidaceae bacterium]
MRVLLGQPAPQVAPRLLGWLLTHETEAGIVTVELTEVEAYAGERDPASHAFRGSTSRNEVMFGPPGRLYVYLSYGMHWCANVVTGPDGHASAVLLRAARVVEGVDLARSRRGARVLDRALARGPACLTQALGINSSHNTIDLLGGGPLRLAPPRSAGLSATGTARAASVADKSAQMATGPRVGVSQAADVPWRFWLYGDQTVSAYKRSPRAPAGPPATGVAT